MFRWYCVYLAVAAWVLLLPLESGAVKEAVKDVRFRTHGDKVYISYTLEGRGEYEVSLRLSDDGGRTFSIVPMGPPLSGAVGKGVEPGPDKQIIWDVLRYYPRDYRRLEGSDYVFQVTTHRSAFAGGTKTIAGAAVGILLGGYAGHQAGTLNSLERPVDTWGRYGILIGIGGAVGAWLGSASKDMEVRGRSLRGSIYLSRRQPPIEQTPLGWPTRLVVEEKRRAEPADGGGIDIEEIPRGAQTRREQGLAVIMGVERYKHAPPATWKLRDATTFYQYSRDVLGIPEDRIMLRTDEDATKAEFDYIFDPKAGWLKKRLRDLEAAAETDLFVYLAGHGYPDLATGRPYLIPQDVRPEQATNGVSLHDLCRTLNDLRTRSVTIFVESCFSGMTGYQSGPPQLLAMNTNPVGPVMERPLVGPAMVVYTATSGDKPSSNRDDLKHGIFTYFVLKGLGGEADGNGDRAVSVEELYRYLAKEVPAKAVEPPLDREQVPEVWPSVDRLGDRGQRILVQY